MDLGCGPGLFLRDFGERYPSATLYGYDVTPAMVAYGHQLSWAGAKPTLLVHDAAAQPLPHAAGTMIAYYLLHGFLYVSVIKYFFQHNTTY